MQLEFFPRTELKTLSDFQKLEMSRPERSELLMVMTHPHFFQSPKANHAISIKHSKIIDHLLDYRAEFYEQMLIEDALQICPEGNHETWGPEISGGVQSWIGLDLETLQTPYGEIYRILNQLKIKPYQTIVDLGAAYGRMGIIIGAQYLKNYFIGYEFIKSRVDEGNRLYQKFNFGRCLLKQADLSQDSFQIPEADVFFIYDFGQVEHIEKMLLQIQRLAFKRPIKIAVKGRYSNMIMNSHDSWAEKYYDGHFSLYKAFLN
jgi:hypothetical protein